jgi:S-adenosylmethionine-diacylgycerolhomoserine-N-methlytransferase
MAASISTCSPMVEGDHATRMDRIYGGQRHIYDLTRKYYLFGRDRLIDGLDLHAGGTLLEIGCGTGRNLVRAARAWPGARLYGIDISTAMLTTARANVAAAGLSDRITLAQGDAGGFDAQVLFGVARFDRVMFSYTLSMIPPWREALGQGLAVTRDTGRLAVVDFGTQSGWPAIWRKPFLAWLAHFDVTPRADLAAELSRIAASHGRKSETQKLWRDYSQIAWVA